MTSRVGLYARFADFGFGSGVSTVVEERSVEIVLSFCLQWGGTMLVV